MPEVEAAKVPDLPGISDFLISLVPANPFAAASSGAILPLIVFTTLVAAAAGTWPNARPRTYDYSRRRCQRGLIKLVWWILYTAPIGIFGLIAPATALAWMGADSKLGIFIVCVFIGLIMLMVLVFLPLLFLGLKWGRHGFFKGTLGAASIALSTTSTARPFLSL